MFPRAFPPWLLTLFVLFAASGTGFILSAAAAPDDEQEESKDAPDADAVDERPLKEQWDDAWAQRKELIEKLIGLQQEFPKATDERKEEIQQEFLEARKELILKILPKLSKIGPKVYEEDPENLDAGDVAVQDAYEHMRYAEAAKLAAQVLKSAGEDRDSVITANIEGVSRFALHDFAKAHEIFTALKEAGKLHDELGARYLEPSEEYADFWKEEQALRKKEAAAKGDDLLPRVLFKTSRGDIELELFENEAPNTVANFIHLVEEKKYDGIKFHRIIPNFMAQGGDPNTLDDDPQNDGQGGPGHTIKCECYAKNARRHFRGSLSMAHAGKDTGGSQFFLTHLPTPHLNADPKRKGGHTVFGRVIKGMDVVDALEVGDTIESAVVERKRDHEYAPETEAEKSE